MAVLYVTSSESGSGKTTICAGLGKYLLIKGKKVGFFKPIIADSKNLPRAGTDSDALFMKHILSLDEPADLLCPVFGDEHELRMKVREAYTRVSSGKDIVLIEGVANRPQVHLDIAAALGAKMIIVESYSQELLKAVDSYKELGGSLLGIVVNKVPRNRLTRVCDEVSQQLEKTGLNALGVLPEERVLLAPTISELAEYLGGKILSGAEKSAELVENLMLGAMTIDSGLEYFGRKTNKAVIVRVRRPDMQLAALETPTRCLVLVGKEAPNPYVLHLAEEKKVPIILAGDDMMAVVENIECALAKTRFNQENKLTKLDEVMAQYFDFSALNQGLGLAG